MPNARYSRRHYTEIALLLSDNRPGAVSVTSRGVTSLPYLHWSTTVKDFIRLFTADNERFDQERFKDACHE